MNDIFDIKGAQNFLGTEFVYLPVLIILFFIVFFIILDLYFSSKKDAVKKEKKSKKETNDEVKYEVIIVNKLFSLQENVDKLDKSKFYLELNNIFRDYLGYIYNKNLLKSTFEEIKLESLLSKNKSSNKLILLFRRSYDIEFSDKKDTILKRKNILKSFIKILNDN
ncbi:hypothetical protein CSA08_01910 [Candidatus Gracilibacteria bacterium]|nr:MAG: hypothetical protein CSA08_01910 [Candidatus Gracilibacteria bacterium]